jgi:transposase
VVDAVKQGSPEYALMRSLAIRFSGILRSHASKKLDFWIDDAVSSGLAPIVRFARVLHRDIGAVRNAIELPWSNGPADGQINRLNMAEPILDVLSGCGRKAEFALPVAIDTR